MIPAARVVPDVASFSVDDGFWYSIPEHLQADLNIGSIVRVPLSGRRVRGWVVEVGEHAPERLREIGGISGAAPVFGADHLKSLQWAATHYVAPMSVMLTRATPPNLPRKIPCRATVEGGRHRPHPLDAIVARSAADLNSPVTALVGNWHRGDWLPALSAAFESGKSVQVISASVAEARTVGEMATAVWGDLVAIVSGEDDAVDTAAWELAQSAPRLVIGTPKTSTWRVDGLALAVVLEEGRRAMKDRQTPTLHVRDVMRTRSRVEGFNVVFLGPTPSVELLAAGAEILGESARPWSLVEIVDRADDAPGSGFLSDRVVAALSATAKAGKRSFVFTHRRSGLASTRCSNCRLLRTCTKCASRLGRVASCPKCGTEAGACTRCGSDRFEEMGTVPDRLVTEINRRTGSAVAAVHPTDLPVSVGTERDLANLEIVDLAVAADVDGMLLGTGYRTSEEALRQLGRLASMVGPAQGSRLMLQTSRPDSLLVKTMRRGEPVPYLERVLVERAREGFPPSSEMIALEVRGDVPDSVHADLGELDAGAGVMGPIETEDGLRWLLVGKLAKTRPQLRKIVGRWRDRGATVRVDADPIDV